jgi:heat shock protein HslJ
MIMSLDRRPSALLIPLVLLAAACGAEDDTSGSVAGDGTATVPATSAPSLTAPSEPSPSSSSTPPVTAADLDGRAFVATAATGRELVADSAVRVEFEGDRLSGSGGCNSFGTSGWSVDGGVLVATGGFAMTEMACDPPELMDQDVWLTELLGARPTLELAGDALTISSGDVTLTLTDREVVDPDRPLEGTTWELEGLIGGDAVSSVPMGVEPPTLTIEGDRLQAFLGCNQGQGAVAVGAGTMEIEPLATTRMACQGEAGEVERDVLTVLDGTVQFTIEADQLTLTNGDAGLIYRAGA